MEIRRTRRRREAPVSRRHLDDNVWQCHRLEHEPRPQPPTVLFHSPPERHVLRIGIRDVIATEVVPALSPAKPHFRERTRHESPGAQFNPEADHPRRDREIFRR